MEQLATVGLDLTKDVIAACVLDVHGAVIERRMLGRAAFERWAEQLPASNVAMETCGSAHHRVRGLLAEYGVVMRRGQALKWGTGCREWRMFASAATTSPSS